MGWSHGEEKAQRGQTGMINTVRVEICRSGSLQA